MTNRMPERCAECAGTLDTAADLARGKHAFCAWARPGDWAAIAPYAGTFGHRVEGSGT